ncbi:Uncharacterised protein [Serratia quinivorans]|uniref:Uncharacterized protein n=1 Tax=Serratia quinivorans TaxID=137545 RepID=A0A379YNV6_9GAMM|nr:Uncharacterised protein [Serratia quinivorans]
MMAGKIGHHRHALPYPPAGRLTAETDNFAAYFMAQDPRITKERLLTGPGVNIRAANAHGNHFDHRFGLRRNRCRTLLIN